MASLLLAAAAGAIGGWVAASIHSRESEDEDEEYYRWCYGKRRRRHWDDPRVIRDEEQENHRPPDRPASAGAPPKDPMPAQTPAEMAKEEAEVQDLVHRVSEKDAKLIRALHERSLESVALGDELKKQREVIKDLQQKIEVLQNQLGIAKGEPGGEGSSDASTSTASSPQKEQGRVEKVVEQANEALKNLDDKRKQEQADAKIAFDEMEASYQSQLESVSAEVRELREMVASLQSGGAGKDSPSAVTGPTAETETQVTDRSATGVEQGDQATADPEASAETAPREEEGGQEKRSVSFENGLPTPPPSRPPSPDPESDTSAALPETPDQADVRPPSPPPERDSSTEASDQPEDVTPSPADDQSHATGDGPGTPQGSS